MKKEKSVVAVLSHMLTDNQKSDLKVNWNVSKIIDIPYIIKSKWSNIDPEGELDFDLINKIENFIINNTNSGDYVIVQGEFGMTVLLVNECIKKGRIPIYATSRRNVQEHRNGEKVETIRSFEHIQFRKYRFL